MLAGTYLGFQSRDNGLWEPDIQEETKWCGFGARVDGTVTKFPVLSPPPHGHTDTIVFFFLLNTFLKSLPEDVYCF